MKLALALGGLGLTATAPTAATPPLLTLALHADSPAFPPGGRLAHPAQFWAASPIGPLATGPLRPAADLIASGEAAMLGWAPTSGAAMVTALSDSHSLVRLLGGGSTAAGTGSPPDGDVVLRNAHTGELDMVWPLLWARLDPWVNASGANIKHPILVLDNVPYAFCDPAKCNANGSFTPGALYGMDFGPHNVTEYGEWIETLLRAMSARYGESRASEFWFRVATEPNTRPGHWNDTSAKYVAEYAAVAAAVERALPRAKVGLANMGADGSHWIDDVTPMGQGVAESGARVDFIAMSCYGRGTHGTYRKRGETRYDVGTAAFCASRLASMRALGGDAWASVPAQTMEYGLQQNSLDIVDDDPGVFQAAWMVATSFAHARTGMERSFHWHEGEVAFAHDKAQCSKAISASKCSLYKGTSWVQAQASHLFGNASSSTAAKTAMLDAAAAGSNASGTTSADGLAGFSEDGRTLRLLVAAFDPTCKTSDGPPARVEIAFQRPASWAASAASPKMLELRSATLNRSTSPFDALLLDAQQNGWLTNASDPNVYPLSKAAMHMLTDAGRSSLEAEKGAHFLAMQRATFASTAWREAGSDDVTCTDSGACTLTLLMTPPSVVAMWIQEQNYYA